MTKLHDELCKLEWYRNWHDLPHVSYVHFVVLLIIAIGVGILIPNKVSQMSQLASVLTGTSTNSGQVQLEADETHAGTSYGPWFSISKWSHCSHLMQQGSVFELQNAEGVTMMSECTPEVPATPFGWNSAPVRFRLVKEPLPRHSPQTPNRASENSF